MTKSVGGILLTIKKRTMVRIVCYCLVLAAVLGGTTLLHIRVGQTYRLLLENSYRRAVSDVTRSLDELEQGLHTGLVMSSPAQVSGAAMQLLSASTSGKAALESLPLPDDSLYAVQLYLAQIGDYAAALQREAVTENSISAECRENLSRLLEFNESLQEVMTKIEQMANEGGALMPSVEDEILSNYGNLNPDGLPFVTELMAQGQLGEYPTLMYDGRYSFHMLEPAAYAYAFEGEEIDEQQAKEVAAEFLGVPVSSLEISGETAGDVPSFLLNYRDVAVEISKTGGRVVTMLNGRDLKEAVLPMEDAFGVAESFLEAAEYHNMVQVGYLVGANQMTLEYVYEQDGVRYYPDSVSVTVALDEGDVVGFSAEKFLRSHTERRTGAAPKLNTANAESYLPEGHNLGGARYAVVASEGGIESQTLELTTTLDDHTYLYYLDVMNGLEMKLNRLIEDDSGKRIK